MSKEDSPDRELMLPKSDLGARPEGMSSLILCVIFKELHSCVADPRILDKNNANIIIMERMQNSPKAMHQIELVFT